ncbi:major facilitator superfamily transporter [Fusarium coicis]|nr:major facilitator superfamily transporter [Fusarium coicis]
MIDISVSEVEPEDLSHLRLPAKYKWTVLFLVIALPLGHTWTGSALGPLKNILREELGISNTQSDVISSADAFVNTVFPIVGGLIVDWWGPNIVTLCCTSVILVGSIVAAVGVQIGLCRLLVSGHVLMGFGIAVSDSATQKAFYPYKHNQHGAFLLTGPKFLYHCFAASGLPLAFGL